MKRQIKILRGCIVKLVKLHKKQFKYFFVIVPFMGEKFSFDHLSATDFEEYCFDLIKKLGFKNVDWRKGTGKSTSPSDEGRDIEADKIIDEYGEITIEKWFFDCKHHIAGVPPEKIQGALSWAFAERPDKLVIICSNFLSNPCKEYLKKYIQENKPPFKIKIWERTDLEGLSIGKNEVLNKYKLSDGLDFLNLINPLHIKYVTRPYQNTLDYLFSVLDKYDDKKREEIIQFTYMPFIAPRFKESITGKEKLRDLQIDETSYDTLKEKCQDLSQFLPESFIVNSLVNLILKWTFQFGDKTNLETIIENNQDMVNFLEEEVSKGKRDETTLREIIKKTKNHIGTLSQKTEYWYNLYNDFCENVLARLVEEDIMVKENVMINPNKIYYKLYH